MQELSKELRFRATPRAGGVSALVLRPATRDQVV
jgi:hypothetical protein